MTLTPTLPTLEKLVRLEVEVGAPTTVGETPDGDRKLIPILGGRFEGEKLNGKILPGGADFLLTRKDDTSVLDARYVLETTDGVKIYAEDSGYRHGPPEVMQRLARGETVDPADYYSRSRMKLSTANTRYAWVNNLLVIGSGMRLGQRVLIDLFIVR